MYQPETQVRVVVHGDDCTFANTELAPRKIEAEMCEWYDVMERGVPGDGKRDVHEILHRCLRLTEEGLEYVASDKHRRAFLQESGVA